MTSGRSIIEIVAERQDLDQFRKKNWEGTFEEYLDMVRSEPQVTRNAFERVYDMILSYGTETVRGVAREAGPLPLLRRPGATAAATPSSASTASLAVLVNAFKSAAQGYGIEKRVLLLHGPVGSSKSTIARLLKKGLERYSARDDGALYTLGWVDSRTRTVHWCPMNEEPLHLVPERFRDDVAAPTSTQDRVRGRIPREIIGELCPFCRYVYTERLKHYAGDWTRVVQDVRVKRLILSEKDRIGIGTFQPKDEKNQDSTELTGDINYRKIAEYGSDSDPRAFNFDGEFNVANRGIDRVRRSPEARRGVPLRPAGRQPGAQGQAEEVRPDRHRRGDPGPHERARVSPAAEQRVHGSPARPHGEDRRPVRHEAGRRDQDLREGLQHASKVQGKHIAPHTIEMAAMWAILTRLEEPKNASLTLLQKLKLYNGKSLPGFTEDNIKELREQAVSEGMHGISPRYVQDKISNALVAHPDATSRSIRSWCSTSSRPG